MPSRCPLRVCYDPRHKRSEITEDKRSGPLLYADLFEAGGGALHWSATFSSAQLKSRCVPATTFKLSPSKVLKLSAEKGAQDLKLSAENGGTGVRLWALV